MHSHKKIRIAFQRVKLQLCSILRRTHAEKSTAVSLRLRNGKALHNQTFDFMQIDHLWLNLFDFDLTWFYCVCVFFNHIHHVQFCHLWREGYLFLCAAVCFPLQLHRMWSVSNSPAVCRAGHFTCTVCDSGPLNSARTRGYLVFSKGACNG